MSLDDFGAFFIQKLVAAIGTEQLDLFVAELLPVTIELAFALRAGYPKNFRQRISPSDARKIRNSKHEIRNKLEVK
jgi:hypothetical protein